MKTKKDIKRWERERWFWTSWRIYTFCCCSLSLQYKPIVYYWPAINQHNISAKWDQQNWACDFSLTVVNNPWMLFFSTSRSHFVCLLFTVRHVDKYCTKRDSGFGGENMLIFPHLKVASFILFAKHQRSIGLLSMRTTVEGGTQVCLHGAIYRYISATWWSSSTSCSTDTWWLCSLFFLFCVLLASVDRMMCECYCTDLCVLMNLTMEFLYTCYESCKSSAILSCQKRSWDIMTLRNFLIVSITWSLC